MKKLLSTIILTLGLLGGSIAIAPHSVADPVGTCRAGECPPPPEECNRAGGCTPPVVECPRAGGCDAVGYLALLTELGSLEQTANDYRAQVAQLTAQTAALTAKAEAATAKAARAWRVADRRAATIKRLRAKIRSLR